MYFKVIFFQKDQYDIFKKNIVLYDILKEFGSAEFVDIKNKYKKNSKGKLFFDYLSVIKSIINLIISRRSIYFKVKSVDSLGQKIIVFLNSFTGRTFTFPSTAGTMIELQKRLYDDYGIPRGIEKEQSLSTLTRNCANGFLINSIDSITYLSLQGYFNFKNIGFPTLFDEFKDFIKKNSNSYLEKELAKNKINKSDDYVTIFCNKYFGRWASKDIEWFKSCLIDCVDCIRNDRPRTVILLRLHPTLDDKIIEDLVSELQIENILITALHPSVLANVSNYAIGIAQSSVFLSVMSMGKAYIEYGEMTETNYELFPEGSLYAQFGTLPIKTKKELEFKIKNNDLKIDIKQFEKKIKHKVNISYFD